MRCPKCKAKVTTEDFWMDNTGFDCNRGCGKSFLMSDVTQVKPEDRDKIKIMFKGKQVKVYN